MGCDGNDDDTGLGEGVIGTGVGKMGGVSDGEPVATTFAGEPGGVGAASPELIDVEVQLASVNAAARIGTPALTAALRLPLSGAANAIRTI